MSGERSAVTIPFIPGDGVGPEIMDITRRVLEHAAEKHGNTRINWVHLQAGSSAFSSTGEWLPKATIDTIRLHGVAIKGPLSTPVGGGIRSLNVALRQMLDLYAAVRPVRYFEGVPSPMKEPSRVNMVIFRENTEDVYKGIEWRSGSEHALAVIEFLREKLGADIPDDAGIGIKPISERASKRLVRAALNHAIKNRLRIVTLVHKGNIMKFTEGAFREWGYEVAKEEFGDKVSFDPDAAHGKILVNDRIADNMLQQVIIRPQDYAVLATPNLNGDYLADAIAAQVGGLGMAPSANIGDHCAVFEAVHGTAPKYAGKDLANPCALMLSGAMMLEHLGMKSASEALVSSIASTLRDGIMTQDLARISGNIEAVGTKRFGHEVISRM